jgi:hypothetical protein
VHARDLEWEQNLNGMDNELKSLSEINYTQNQTKESRLKVKTKTMKDLFFFFFFLFVVSSYELFLLTLHLFSKLFYMKFIYLIST